jgi:quercetin dioxygenase-like cupin family protein
MAQSGQPHEAWKEIPMSAPVASPAGPFISPLTYATGRSDKPFKLTFLQTERMLVGMNCLQRGQAQHLHDHPTQDKFYVVLDGSGHFNVNGEVRECFKGDVILCRAGEPHGVENRGLGLLTFLTCIAPWGEA